MQCTNPVSPYKSMRLDMEYPCGQCRACRVNRARDWAVKIMHETDYYDYSTFMTITYDEENVPYEFSGDDGLVQTLCKRDLQLFIKRLRKWLHPEKIKYYACGEYGSRTHRPH